MAFYIDKVIRDYNQVKLGKGVNYDTFVSIPVMGIDTHSIYLNITKEDCARIINFLTEVTADITNPIDRIAKVTCIPIQNTYLSSEITIDDETFTIEVIKASTGDSTNYIIHHDRIYLPNILENLISYFTDLIKE